MPPTKTLSTSGGRFGQGKGVILRSISQDFARIADIKLYAPVVRYAVENAKSQIGWSFDAGRDESHQVTMREGMRYLGVGEPDFGAIRAFDPAETQTDARKSLGIRVKTGEGFAPDFADAIEVRRSHRRVGRHTDFGGIAANG